MRELPRGGGRLYIWIVVAGGVCPERERLLRRVNHAISPHCDVVGELAAVVGAGHSAEFEVVSASARGTLKNVKTAMRDYEDRCQQHRC